MQTEQNKPLISIIIPFYNSAEYINNILSCIKKQTNRNFEVIFVNDGSTDNSESVINDELFGTDVSFRIIRQENKGLGEARNHGLLCARGDWVMFIDADDAIQNFAIENYVETVNYYKNADVILSHYIDVDILQYDYETEKSYKLKIIDNKSVMANFLTRKTVYLAPGNLFNRQFLEENHILFPKIRWSEDQYFLWKVFNNADKIVELESILYNYCHHGGVSIMNSTSVDMMLSSYDIYNTTLIPTISDLNIAYNLLPRWCLGCLHVLAQRGTKVDFMHFWTSVDGKTQMKKLRGFPSLKIKLLARMGEISPSILYCILK